ncbi:MAG: monovalent cation/H+ antiporter complex subunit F [Oscillospiraceae bacterium]|nr:monovalent cation/H+ antiporter complex subunit F [Oscillospiraceae bacterium]MCL2279291.1 monovalent cation/H+ antiporter complex subunit F [Oscillospiraceae bacterium]
MIFIWILLAFMLLFIFKTIKGPTIWDRLLGLSLISVKVIVLIVAYASIFDLAFLLDYAIISTLFGFISIIFITHFIRGRVQGRKK